MKNSCTIFLLIFILTIPYSCNTKKNNSASVDVTDEQVLAVARSKFTSITDQEFRDGKNILTNRCTECHKIKKVESRSEEEWLKIVDKMALKAKLSASEKTALSWYILSYRQAKINKN